jgi:competence protein ComEC
MKKPPRKNGKKGSGLGLGNKICNMIHPAAIPTWKKAPFIRLLIPLMTGIILQWYLQFSLGMIGGAISLLAIILLVFGLLPVKTRFRINWVNGILINVLIMAIAALITHQKDIRSSKAWFGHVYNDSDYLVVRINEPLTEKAKSYKAEAVVEAVLRHDAGTAARGKLLLYFSKDSALPTIKYGNKILLRKRLQSIKNAGNPGAFNYERYAAFQQYFHNAYLKPDDYVLLAENAANPFWQWIYTAKAMVLATLRQHITTKDELGIAEALLIGYKEDLDKDLVQAYSNTGVVHIIAVSGLHLGLIYVLLLWIFNRMPIVKKSKVLKVVLVLSCLWLFALITGASASVLRSAVMFTFIVLGEHAGKKSSMYNSLAVSAAVLLVYNPYFLWDVGFQLSYLAVIGIVAFQQPVYNWFYVQNKWVDKIWKLTAVSISAQLLTFPVCIYYFHQFPVLFLFANLIAVPLSSIILFMEIFLVGFFWVPYVGVYAGKITAWMVMAMNKIILWINELPMALWDKIPANLLTTWLLYALLLGGCYWLLYKSKRLLIFSLWMAIAFAATHAYGKWMVHRQKKIIVYNVPQHRAVDFITGSSYQFVGDSVLLQDGLLQNFHLKPARIAMQLTNRSSVLTQVKNDHRFFSFGNKTILMLDTAVIYQPPAKKIPVDIILLSNNPKLYIPQLASVFDCSCYVFDSSNSLWKINYWKKDCEKLLLRCHSVAEQGAYVLQAE